MCDEKHFQFWDPETGYTFPKGRARSPDHARAAIDEVGGVVYDDGNRRTGAFRISARIASTEEDNLGPGRNRAWRRAWSRGLREHRRQSERVGAAQKDGEGFQTL